MRAIVGWACAWVLIGCAAEVSAPTSEAALVEAYCASIARCPESSAGVVRAHAIDAEACRGAPPPWQRAIDEGWATLDPDGARACIEALRSRCFDELTWATPFLVSLPECSGMLRWQTGGLGAACVGAAQCEPGLVCRVERDDCDGIGVCAEPPPRCVDETDCARPEGADAYGCALEGECWSLTLSERRAPEGEPCGTSELVACEAPLACLPHSSGQLRCQRLPRLGERCVFGASVSVCGPGLICSSGLGGTGMCETLQLLREGEPCEPLADRCNRRLGLVCADRVCTRGEGALGDACNVFARDACERGLVCVSERCVEPAPTGVACGAPRECASGACMGTCTDSCE